MTLRNTILGIMPDPLRAVLRVLHRSLLAKETVDAEQYWRSRASAPGETAVMFTNQSYNDRIRERQLEKLTPYLSALPQSARVLDIGCGIGIVSENILKIRPDLRVVGVDYPEMIKVAKSRDGRRRIDYRAFAAEDFLDTEPYHAILSMGCYSCIRQEQKIQQALDNARAMVLPGGLVIMIDPFHSMKALQRAPYSSNVISRWMTELGFTLSEKSGIMFWPTREVLAGSNKSDEVVSRKFAAGERWLDRLGAHTWADYKVLVFRKDEPD
jgi:2-polyprenyl-3-methyl-5-hydroxy-6-metoxy-1,4-benzoquinol methylase